MRRIVLFCVVGVVLPLVVTSSAWAQGTGLRLSPQTAAPLDVVNVTGFGFSGTNANTQPGVDIRLDTRDAEVLTTVIPDSANNISATIVIPAGTAPGEHLVLGTQLSVRGRQAGFSGPGRGRLRVTAPRAARATAPPGSAPSSPPPAAPAATDAVTALGAAVIALILLAGGTLLAARLRTLNRPLGS